MVGRASRRGTAWIFGRIILTYSFATQGVVLSQYHLFILSWMVCLVVKGNEMNMSLRLEEGKLNGYKSKLEQVLSAKC